MKSFVENVDLQNAGSFFSFKLALTLNGHVDLVYCALDMYVTPEDKMNAAPVAAAAAAVAKPL